MKTVRILLVVLAITVMSAGIAFISQAGDTPGNPEKEKAVSKEPQSGGKATLKIKTGSGNQIGIDLINSVPVRGVQFTITGVKVTEVRTTSRTAGFLAKFSEETGIVIIVSTAADEIAPGKGIIAEIVGKKVPGSDISLSGIKLADRNRQLL